MRKYIVAFIMLFATSTRAQLAAEDQKALKQTQDMMQNPVEMNQYLKKNPNAQHAYDNAAGTFGNDPAAMQELMKLSSSVFENLVKETNGDPLKMQQLMEQYRKDPASLANKFSPAQKRKLRELSNSVKTNQSNP